MTPIGRVARDARRSCRTRASGGSRRSRSLDQPAQDRVEPGLARSTGPCRPRPGTRPRDLPDARSLRRVTAHARNGRCAGAKADGVISSTRTGQFACRARTICAWRRWTTSTGGCWPPCAPTAASRWRRSPARLGVTRATVTPRLDRLVDSGTIVGFSVKVREGRDPDTHPGDLAHRGRGPQRPTRSSGSCAGCPAIDVAAHHQRRLGPRRRTAHRHPRPTSTGCSASIRSVDGVRQQRDQPAAELRPELSRPPGPWVVTSAVAWVVISPMGWSLSTDHAIAQLTTDGSGGGRTDHPRGPPGPPLRPAAGRSPR